MTGIVPGRRDLTRVAVAGASGFIGQALGPVLSRDFDLIALSRAERRPTPGYSICRQVDLFSLSAATKALEGADLAVYLVHSMMPSARLVQGDFGDLDLLCADNFGRAAGANGIRRILYVGGLVPEGAELSEHLRSRLEVESALQSGGVPVTTLRAGMVVGSRGSSYQLLARLVRRLPLMACPEWTRTRMQPVALGEVVASIAELIHQGGEQTLCYDLGCGETLSYMDMMEATATSMQLRRRFIPVPFLSPGLSRLWVSLTTGAPKELVAPLIKSLRHEMLVRPHAHYRPALEAQESVEEMLASARKDEGPSRDEPRAFVAPSIHPAAESKVYSVQRLQPPEGADATWIADRYSQWLSGFMRGLIQIDSDATTGEVHFVVRGTALKLICLQRLAERSSPDRQVFRVTGGLLARPSERGRLEFRQVLTGGEALAALQDFVPRLPWWLYRLTQGPFHAWVMERFRREVRGATVKNQPEEPPYAALEDEA